LGVLRTPKHSRFTLELRNYYINQLEQALLKLIKFHNFDD
jgi:hypothetical protein